MPLLSLRHRKIIYTKKRMITSFKAKLRNQTVEQTNMNTCRECKNQQDYRDSSLKILSYESLFQKSDENDNFIIQNCCQKSKRITCFKLIFGLSVKCYRVAMLEQD